MKKTYLKQIVQWICAIIVGMIIVSCVCFLYYRPVGWLERDKNATSAVWEPNTVLVNFVEGAGITRIDSHGYTNPWDKELAEELILCIGASYVQSKEVTETKKYTSLLNEKLAENNQLKVYNLSRDAYMYPEIVAGFSAAIQEFPQTTVAVLDISNTDFPLEDLEKALVEREYSEEQTGDKLYQQLSMMDKIKIKIKDYLPLISVLKHQASQMEGAEEVVTEKEEVQVSEEEYAKALDTTMKQMRGSFSGEIIILYHPAIVFHEDGTISLKEGNYETIFAKVCEQNNIVFADMSDDFMKAYEERKEVPYGFHNVTMGEGHINKAGHKMIADKLYDLIGKE